MCGQPEPVIQPEQAWRLAGVDYSAWLLVEDARGCAWRARTMECVAREATAERDRSLLDEVMAVPHPAAASTQGGARAQAFPVAPVREVGEVATALGSEAAIVAARLAAVAVKREVALEIAARVQVVLVSAAKRLAAAVRRAGAPVTAALRLEAPVSASLGVAMDLKGGGQRAVRLPAAGSGAAVDPLPESEGLWFLDRSIARRLVPC